MKFIMVVLFFTLTQGADHPTVTSSLQVPFDSLPACRDAAGVLSTLANSLKISAVGFCTPLGGEGAVQQQPDKKPTPPISPQKPTGGTLAMKMKGVGGLIPDTAIADMSCLCTWQDALLSEPKVQDFYVVEVNTPALGTRIALRWYSPSRMSGDRWRDLQPGEFITHWLAGLEQASTLVRQAQTEAGTSRR